MSPRALGPVVLAALVAAGLGSACAPGRGERRTARAGGAGTSLHEGPEEFRDLRATLNRLGARRAEGDAAGARGLFREVLSDGRDALAMPPPHDLRRVDVPTFLEGRANFGDAINAFGRAAGGGSDAEVYEACSRLETAFAAWWDAYRGLPTEGGV